MLGVSPLLLTVSVCLLTRIIIIHPPLFTMSVRLALFHTGAAVRSCVSPAMRRPVASAQQRMQVGALNFNWFIGQSGLFFFQTLNSPFFSTYLPFEPPRQRTHKHDYRCHCYRHHSFEKRRCPTCRRPLIHGSPKVTSSTVHHHQRSPRRSWGGDCHDNNGALFQSPRSSHSGSSCHTSALSSLVSTDDDDDGVEDVDREDEYDDYAYDHKGRHLSPTSSRAGACVGGKCVKAQEQQHGKHQAALAHPSSSPPRLANCTESRCCDGTRVALSSSGEDEEEDYDDYGYDHDGNIQSGVSVQVRPKEFQQELAGFLYCGGIPGWAFDSAGASLLQEAGALGGD